MRILTIFYIILGCASAVGAYYFATSQSTVDFAQEERLVIADCKKKFLPDVSPDKETSHSSEELDNCIDEWKRSIGLQLPFINFLMLASLIMSVLFFSLSWWVNGKRSFPPSLGVGVVILSFIYFVTTLPPTTIVESGTVLALIICVALVIVGAQTVELDKVEKDIEEDTTELPVSNSNRTRVTSGELKEKLKNKLIGCSKQIPAITCFVCASAILFPPWGFEGEVFNSFTFLLSGEVPLSGGSSSTARIAWPILASEIALILFVGLGLHFLFKTRDKKIEISK